MTMERGRGGKGEPMGNTPVAHKAIELKGATLKLQNQCSNQKE